MSLHLYTSTACQHGSHTSCRVVCKFCVAVCLCRCHWKAEATAHTQTIINIEMHRRQEHLDAGLDGQPDPEPDGYHINARDLEGCPLPDGHDEHNCAEYAEAAFEGWRLGQSNRELHTITLATVSTGLWGWSCSCRAKGSGFPSDRMASVAATHHQENGA